MLHGKQRWERETNINLISSLPKQRFFVFICFFRHRVMRMYNEDKYPSSPLLYTKVATSVDHCIKKISLHVSAINVENYSASGLYQRS